MSGRKTPSLASPRSHTTLPHSLHPSTTNPRQPSGESPRKSSEGEDSTQAARARVKLAAAYARVSRDRQEQQESIGSQVEAVQQAAAAGGYELPIEFLFVDDGYSGARLDRPALDRLRVSDVLQHRGKGLLKQYQFRIALMMKEYLGGRSVPATERKVHAKG